MRVQLTFDSVEAKTSIERQSEVDIDGYPCQVVGGGPSLESVLIFHLPYELDNGLIQAAMQEYGEARNCPGRNGEGWGEANAQGVSGALVDGQERGSVDLRDNQLDELSSRDAPGSVSASAASAGPDSLEGATVVLQASTDASQSVLAGLALNSNSPDAPNSDSVNLNSNCPDAPNSDCVNLSNCADLPCNVSNDSLNYEMEVIDGNSNSGKASDISEREIVNGNSNDNDRTVNSNDNGNSESPISSNSNDNNGVVISNDNGNSESIGNNGEMIITETSGSSDSDSEDGEIRMMPPLVVLLVVTSPLLTLFTLRIVMVLCCRCRLSGLLGNPLSWCLLVDHVLCRL